MKPTKWSSIRKQWVRIPGEEVMPTIEQLQEMLNQRAKELQESNKKLKASLAEANELKAANGELTKRLKGSEKSLQDVTAKLNIAQAEVKSTKVASVDLQQEIEKLRGQNTELIRQVAVLETQVKRLPELENELKGTQKQLIDTLKQREVAITAAVQEATREFEAQRTAWAQERAELNAGIKTLQDEVDRLHDKLNQGTTEATISTPEDLANHFAKVIEDIQVQASERKDKPIVGTMRTFEIELKGIVQASEDAKATRIVLPGTGKVDPDQLSTLRMSFGTVPALRKAPSNED
jgi:chromosome segregation ATPase